MKPLRGGLKLNGKKEATLVSWTITRPAPPPRRVRIPLIHPPASPARPCVRVGDRVLRGEKIAEPEGPFGVAIHASISGKVSEIRKFPHPLLGESEAIEILSDGKDEGLPAMGRERPPEESFSLSVVRQTLKDAGVLALDPLSSFPIDTVILNGCESEPYLTSDQALLMTHPVEILRAGEILRDAWGARDLILALEDNKEGVAEVLKSKIFFHAWSHARVEVLPSRYPQEEESVLIRQLLGRPLPPGKPCWEVKVFVLNVASAFALYEALVLQKPFYERVVTVAGECVAQPQNFWLRIGTLVEDGVKYARGFLRPPERVIHGGPMTGIALERLEAPILKSTRAILGLPKEVIRPESVEPCIRCGQCVEVCPVSISPVMITLAAEKDLFDLAQDYGARFCIACGNCTYICPAKRPMAELIQYANAH